MATFEAASAIVRNTYKEIWNDWYPVSSARAGVQLDLSDECSRYSHSNNLIVIAVAEGNLDDQDILDKNAWPTWKIESVHEMLHEWRAKTPCVVTSEAETLCTKYKPAACADGHGSVFFQAIVEKVSYFGTTPKQLVMQI